MHEQYIVLHLFLWVTTLAFLSVFDYLAKRRIGKQGQGFINLRLPKFIALAISSITAIISIYLLNAGSLSLNVADYLAIPYFAANSFFIVAFFREIKAHRL